MYIALLLTTVLAGPAAPAAPAIAAESPPATTVSAEELTRLGLLARLEPDQRDSLVQAIAAHLVEAGRADRRKVQQMQSAFAQPLLLVCDPEVRRTLSPQTVEAVDAAIESVLRREDIIDERWDPLAYVYGYFNHDVTAAEIESVRDEWFALEDDRRQRLYPTFPHMIDAVCKPLSVGPLGSEQETAAALDVALPLLKLLMTARPAPGRAFHPPTHAALVLGALYERWADSPAHGAQVRRHLGDRRQFVRLMTDQLIASREDAATLTPMEVGYYAYTGRYFANALARLNAREAAPALRRSLELYEKNQVKGSTLLYTRRALVALGDEDMRRELEQQGERERLQTGEWLCRNGQSETLEYGQRLLGEALGVAPEQALAEQFRRRLVEVEEQVDARQ